MIDGVKLEGGEMETWREREREREREGGRERDIYICKGIKSVKESYTKR